MNLARIFIRPLQDAGSPQIWRGGSDNLEIRARKGFVRVLALSHVKAIHQRAATSLFGHIIDLSIVSKLGSFGQNYRIILQRNKEIM